MSDVDLYIQNQDRYYGITSFLEIAIEYWVEWAENQDESDDAQKRASEGKQYLNRIKDQRPLEPGPYEMKVSENIAEFASASAHGVDFMVWEIRELPTEQKGDVERAMKTLQRLSN